MAVVMVENLRLWFRSSFSPSLEYFVYLLNPFGEKNTMTSMLIRVFVFFYVISYLKCFINFDTYFFIYNFDIFVYLWYVYIIFCVVIFNYFFVLYSCRVIMFNFIRSRKNKESDNVTSILLPWYTHLGVTIRFYTCFEDAFKFLLRGRLVWWKVTHFSGILIGWNHFQVFSAFFHHEK